MEKIFKNSKVLDRFTSIDDRQAETNKLLRELITVLKAQPRLPAVPVAEILPGGPPERELITPTLEIVLLDSIERKMATLEQVLAGVNLTERIDWSFTYPSEGGDKAVDIGDLVIDFYEGTVQLPDGTKEDLHDNLKNHDKIFIRSYFIKPTKQVKFNLDGRGNTTIEAGDVHMETLQNFQKLYIRILEDSTKIRLWACTNPSAVRKVLAVADIATPSTSIATYARTLIGTTAVQLRPANATRLELVFRNKHTSATVYWGKDSSVTATNASGYLKPDDGFMYELGNLYRGAIYLISDTPDTPIFWEEIG